MTDKEKIIRILGEFKWGKLWWMSPHDPKEIEKVAGQIIEFLTQIVRRRISKQELLHKEHKLKKQCPWCGVTDMYSHYVDGPRHYRLCKWCGMLQNMGEKSQQCTLIQCVIDGRHRYWTIDPHKKRKCAHCGGKMEKVTIPQKNDNR